MKTIFYWSPHLSTVATIKNVVNSAYSLVKYDKKNFNTYIIDAIGEWSAEKKKILEKNINYFKLFNFRFNLPISGFYKSRFLSMIIFVSTIVPLFLLLKKEKPNYLIIHLLTSIPLTLLLLFNFETKFILRISGLPKLNIMRKFLWKSVSRKISLITCPTNETLEYINKMNIFDRKKVVLLNDPILNISEIIKKKKENISIKTLKQKYFLSIGRLTKQKNHQLLIKLISNLNKKNKDVYLYIIGEGEEKQKLQKQIHDLELENNIFLLGHKNNVFPYISSSEAVISPSLWEDPGAVMIEAAFCNKIVISSDCSSGPKEFLMNDKAGYLFKNGELNSITKVLNNFLRDTQKQIYDKKKLAKKNSKKYSIFSHFLVLRKFLT